MSMTTMSKLNDPVRARAYFEAKLAFTTGPVELDHMIKSGENNFQVVDVRAEDDFLKGHIPGAINLPQERWDTLEGLQRGKLHILCCYSHTCHLAAKAAVEFASKGFSVMEMDGGFEEWKKNDLDIEQESVNRLKKSASSWFHRST
jgi:rhodanese-related sulfurtransferase